LGRGDSWNENTNSQVKRQVLEQVGDAIRAEAGGCATVESWNEDSLIRGPINGVTASSMSMTLVLLFCVWCFLLLILLDNSDSEISKI
jgi:hypothetical protein